MLQVGYTLDVRGNMAADLIFVGGAKGVGKTSLLGRLQQVTNLSCINTGEIFTYARQNKLNPEEEISNYLLNSHFGLVDTHYAGYSSNKFVRGLSKDSLHKISLSKRIDLILIELEPEILMERRINDPNIERIKDIRLINEEIELNRMYFKEYCSDLSIEGLVVQNIDIDQTINVLLRRISK